MAVHRPVSSEPDRNGNPHNYGLQKIAAAVRPAEAEITMVRSTPSAMSYYDRDRKFGLGFQTTYDRCARFAFMGLAVSGVLSLIIISFVMH